MRSHKERYRILLQLVAAERAAHPLEFQFLEYAIFRLAESRGLIPVYVPAPLPNFTPDDEDTNWEELVSRDGRVWIAYI
jgi:hypothetical protein